jgi:hypothetical protein
VVAEREAKRAAAGTTVSTDTEELTDEDRQQGVQIHRVSVRGSAGRIRQIPYKIMPDPDDGSRFLIVQRDPESGDMVPSLRRGTKRYVERARDGTWEMSRD